MVLAHGPARDHRRARASTDHRYRSGRRRRRGDHAGAGLAGGRTGRGVHRVRQRGVARHHPQRRAAPGAVRARGRAGGAGAPRARWCTSQRGRAEAVARRRRAGRAGRGTAGPDRGPGPAASPRTAVEVLAARRRAGDDRGDRPADQHRAAARHAPGAGRRADRADRGDGRIAGTGQRHRRRGVQRALRPGGGAPGAQPDRGAGDDGAAGHHPALPGRPAWLDGVGRRRPALPRAQPGDHALPRRLPDPLRRGRGGRARRGRGAGGDPSRHPDHHARCASTSPATSDPPAAPPCRASPRPASPWRPTSTRTPCSPRSVSPRSARRSAWRVRADAPHARPFSMA